MDQAQFGSIRNGTVGPNTARSCRMGIQHSALQLNFFEAVLIDHLAAFPHRRRRTKHLAVFVLICAIPAASAMLIEQISGESHSVANAAADDITNRFADGLANEIETGDFNCCKGSILLIERVFAGYEPCL
jgi:hypothetical protein